MSVYFDEATINDIRRISAVLSYEHGRKFNCAVMRKENARDDYPPDHRLEVRGEYAFLFYPKGSN